MLIQGQSMLGVLFVSGLHTKSYDACMCIASEAHTKDCRKPDPTNAIHACHPYVLARL